MLLEERALAWRREFLRQVLAEGLTRLVFAAAAFLAAVLWIDHFLTLSQGARWLVLSLGSGLLAAGAYALIARPCLGCDWGEILGEAAARFPELRDYLRPAWELSRAGPAPYTSEELKRAHLEKTEGLLRRLPDAPVFAWRPSRAARRGAALAMAGGLTLPWLGPSPALNRVLRPWRDLPLESYVQIKPGDAKVDWGKTVTIGAEWSEVSPMARDSRALKLWLKGRDGWTARPWDRLTRLSAGFSAEELTSPLLYRLTWRYLTSRVYRLTPVAVPQLAGLEARISGSQTRIIPLSAAEPLSVLRGTWITLSGRPSEPLAKASLRLSSLAAPAPMKLSPSGDYEASLPISEDAAFHFELETQDGRRDPNPVVYAIKALPDQPPKAELLSPLIPLQASPRDAVPITYSAQDDGGLVLLSLLVRPEGSPEREIVLQRFSGRLEFIGDYAWDLSGLKPGKFEFRIKAVDNASPPQNGYSEKGFLEVVDFEAGHARVESLWRAAEEDLKSLLGREERAAQANEIKGLPEAWKETVGRFSELALEMQKDAYANPGLSEQVKAHSQGLSRAEREELPAALEASRAGDLPAARGRHEKLALRLRQAGRMLAEGKALQGLEDFYTEAGRMSQAGADLERALESLAKGGGRKGSGEGLEKLKSALSELESRLESLRKALEALPKIEPGRAREPGRTYALPVAAARRSAEALAQALAGGDYETAARMARQLSEALSEVERSIGQAASEAAGEGSARESSARLDRIRAQWSEVIEEQTRVLERTQRLKERRVAQKLAAQRELLAALAREQAVIVSSAQVQGAGPSAEVLSAMRGVQREFEQGKVSQAPASLKGISLELRAQGSRERSRASALEWFALTEERIRAKLDEGPPPSAEGPSEEAGGAAQGQAAVRRKTARLEEDLQGFEFEVGSLPGAPGGKLQGAQAEQGSAEGALKRGASEEAADHEEKALALLTQGGSELNQSAGGQRELEISLLEPFSRPATGLRAARGGGQGAQLGFVPLPSAKDYLPPKEIREELEKSLQESRPAAYDGVIKEYFKRISQ